jgi:hypothetical protein
MNQAMRSTGTVISVGDSRPNPNVNVEQDSRREGGDVAHRYVEICPGEDLHVPRKRSTDPSPRRRFPRWALPLQIWDWIGLHIWDTIKKGHERQHRTFCGAGLRVTNR